MKNESVKKSLEKSKNVLIEKRKIVRRKICIKKTHTFTIIAMNCVQEQLIRTHFPKWNHTTEILPRTPFIRWVYMMLETIGHSPIYFKNHRKAPTDFQRWTRPATIQIFLIVEKLGAQ